MIQEMRQKLGKEIEELSHELEQGGAGTEAAAKMLGEEVHELGLDRVSSGDNP